MRKLKDYILIAQDKGLFKFLNDKTYIKMRYRLVFNKKLNLNDPKTYNEKIQYLKLYDHKSIYTTMVDKYAVKEYISNIIGKEYVIPTLGIYDSFDDIDFTILPNSFVIKCTHDSGGLIIVKDKDKLDIKKAKKKINKYLKRNFYYLGREWPYKNVKPRIIIEKYMEDKNNETIRDYKFFCFNGIPKLLYVSDGSHTNNQKLAFFDINYKYVDIKRTDYNEYDILPEKPVNFEKMKELAAILSKDIPHVRVDFYEINGKIYFGELTFYTNSGYIPFEKEEWNIKLGEFISLPKRGDINEK